MKSLVEYIKNNEITVQNFFEIINYFKTLYTNNKKEDHNKIHTQWTQICIIYTNIFITSIDHNIVLNKLSELTEYFIEQKDISKLSDIAAFFSDVHGFEKDYNNVSNHIKQFITNVNKNKNDDLPIFNSNLNKQNYFKNTGKEEEDINNDNDNQNEYNLNELLTLIENVKNTLDINKLFDLQNNCKYINYISIIETEINNLLKLINP